MGQLFSHALRHSPTPPLLRLPVEIILLIAAHLSSSPESIAALSLTCKPLSIIFKQDVMTLRFRDRGALLVLLEKDLGGRFFYCPTCCQLHRFSPRWSPTNMGHTEYRNIKHNHYYCLTRQIFNPNSTNSPYKLYYPLARLVMNRYFYGAPIGLPLETLAQPVFARSWAGGPLWLQSPHARVIDGELFLCITHTLEGRAAIVRDAIDEGRYCICMHLATDLVDRARRNREKLYKIPELTRPDGERPPGSGSSRPPPFRVCRDALGSCGMCLTDYTVTIESGQVREVTSSTAARNRIRFGRFIDGWRVTITSYHQVGPCRDMDDWKWVTLVGGRAGQPTSEAWFRCMGTYPGRDTTLYPPGIVRQKWQAWDHRPQETVG